MEAGRAVDSRWRCQFEPVTARSIVPRCWTNCPRRSEQIASRLRCIAAGTNFKPTGDVRDDGAALFDSVCKGNCNHQRLEWCRQHGSDDGLANLGEDSFLLATLYYFGLGVQQPTPSWGNALANALSNFTIAWWASIFPAACLFRAALAIEVAGARFLPQLALRARSV